MTRLDDKNERKCEEDLMSALKKILKMYNEFELHMSRDITQFVLFQRKYKISTNNGGCVILLYCYKHSIYFY